MKQQNLVLAAAVLAASAAVHAAPFTPTSLTASIHTVGQVRIDDGWGSGPGAPPPASHYYRVDAYTSQTAILPGLQSLASTANHSVTPDEPYSVTDHTKASYAVGPERIRFDGFAEVWVNAPYDRNGGWTDGYISATLDFNYRFHVNGTRQVQLSMQSDLWHPWGAESPDDYKFLLADGQGTVLWDRTYISHIHDRSFTRLLTLTEGDYTLSATLFSDFHLNGLYGDGKSLWANFSVAVVPEPSTLALALAGLPIVCMARRRRS